MKVNPGEKVGRGAVGVFEGGGLAINEIEFDSLIDVNSRNNVLGGLVFSPLI